MTDQQANRPTAGDIAASPPLAASYLEDPRLPNGLVLSSYGRRLLGTLLEAVLMSVTLIVGWLIWSAATWGKGQSPAKQLMKMRVVDAKTGEAAGWGRMCTRELLLEIVLFSLVSAFTFGIIGLIGTLLIFGGEWRQTGWDRLAKTVVVDDPQGVALSR